MKVLGEISTFSSNASLSGFISTVSIANDVACKSLDWLETTFPGIHAPTEEVTLILNLIEPHRFLLKHRS